MIKNTHANTGDIKQAGLIPRLPKWLNDKESTWQCIQSLGWEDPLEEEMATHSVFLLGKSHGQRSLVGYSPWGHERVRHEGATEHTLE